MSKIREDFKRCVEDTYSDTGFTGAGGDYWGNAGSGLLFTTGSKILLLKRSYSVEQPGTWGIPGGAIPEEDGRLMDAYTSAKKESSEEMGKVPAHKVVDKYVFEDRGFRFTTFICKVTGEFSPSRLNWENDDFGWFSDGDLAGLPLHFGVKALLAKKKVFRA